jgi:hypothetical protein
MLQMQSHRHLKRLYLCFAAGRWGPGWSSSSLIGQVSSPVHPRHPFLTHQFSLFPLSGDFRRTAQVFGQHTIRIECSWLCYVTPSSILSFNLFRNLYDFLFLA